MLDALLFVMVFVAIASVIYKSGQRHNSLQGLNTDVPRGRRRR